jgi:hypothetical protein
MGAETKVPVICGRRNCTRCTRWLHVNEFHARRRAPNGEPTNLQTHCKACQRAISRYNLGMKRRGKPYGKRKPKMTLEERKAHRRKIYAKRIKDPKYKEERREYERIYAEIMRRRAGVPRRNFSQTTLSGYGERLPPEPQEAWIQKKLSNGYMNDKSSLALACGVDPRALDRVLRHEYESITEDFVDGLLTNEGSTDLWEVYPHLYDMDAAGS